MSLSDDTGPYCSRQWPTDFKNQGLKSQPPPRFTGPRAHHRERGGAPGSFGQPRPARPTTNDDAKAISSECLNPKGPDRIFSLARPDELVR